MQKDKISFMLLFTAVVCVLCSFLLALVNSALRPLQEENKRIDRQINILKAFRPEISPEGKALTEEEVKSYFVDGKVPREWIPLYMEKFVQESFLTAEGKPMVEEEARALLADAKAKVKPLPVFTWKQDGEVVAYAYPSEGKGLWSTVHSYVGLEKDLASIRGITFFDHGETPGLGGECSKPWFQMNFWGKELYKDGAPVDFKIPKGKADPDDLHAVDGISGATLTAKGIEKFLNKDFRRYNPYFETLRK